MGTTRLDYFYDGQVRSYLLQVVSAFHGFCYQSLTRDGEPVLRQIPVRWGNQSRMVAHILRNNSENIINSAPFITVYISSMSHAPERRQDPLFVDHLKVAERKFDTESGLYTKDLGNLYSVERSMPVPYDMGIKVDIWTTSEEQKLQIFEQLAVLFNPEVWFQSNVNPLDWTAITTIIQDGIEWSSRSVPVGTESSIDIMSWTFLVPIWINPPAKVRRQSVIHQIVTNIVEHECFGIGWDNRYGDSDLLAQIVTTPNNHQIRVDNEEVTLLSADGSEVNGFGNIFAWKPLLEKYGVFKPGSTRLYIKRYATDLDDYTHDVTGILDYHPTKENVLLFTLDPLSLPGNTLQPINAVIDPHVQYPGYGLPLPILGQRYLLTENTWTEEVGGEDKNSQSGYTEAWQQLTANANDIIEYTNSGWAVAFSAFASQDQQFVLNSYSGKQLTFDGKNWVLAVDGEYHPGFWRLGIAGFNPGTDEELCA